MENLLKIYAYNSGRIKYEFIDPDKNPGLVKRYGVTQDATTIFEAGGKESRITATGEEDVTNALIKVTRVRQKVIYFLEGHGESALAETEDSGYATARTELEKLGYEVKKQTLALAANFPKDCALLVVPGPQKDLLANELETLKTYIQGGGRVLFMVDPETQVPGLVKFLGQYGFKLDDDLIVDTVSRILGGDYFMPVVSEYEDHAITRKFNYATFYPYARSVEVGETKPEGETVTALAKTSSNSWAERELKDKEVKFTAGKDRQGPVSLAAVATLKVRAEAAASPAAKPGEKQEEKKGEEKEARLAVVGDSDWAKNRYYNLSGNGNFFLNIANWLTEESDLISIQPRTQSPRTIQLMPAQMSLINLIVLYLLPLGILVFGLGLWLRRRSL
ncbi:MAG TPA: Gldg family protein, partial [Burkholderiales bacterium]|nr:Gldg family protein [Burkholderiales bacterium]